ncbi:MAG TPA: DUF5996 family protein [Solirubrobacteraceae bacterium]|jgi:hypothetical protein
MDPSGRDLPDLPLAAWEASKDTLHLCCQVVGKLQLAASIEQNHWWNVTLRVGPRGLETQRLHDRGRRYGLAFDFVDHRLELRTEDGVADGFALRDGVSVAAFFAEVTTLLDRAGIATRIAHPKPFGVPMTTPFAEDTEHASYDAARVHDYWRALLWIDGVLAELASRFTGKQSPVQLFWHSFDLALNRFSGRTAPGADGMDPVSREAYSHEVISHGWWAGSADTPAPAFYSYAAPEPAGLAGDPLAAGGQWVDTGNGHLALLMYDDVRAAPDPRAAALDFFQSAFDAAARRADWPAGLSRV